MSAPPGGSAPAPGDKKLAFQVVYASGEDPEYPATELNFHSPQTRGWQSQRFCEFPCELGVAFLDGVVNVSLVQLLSHQHKIATRVELFVGVGDDYLSSRFQRLGYMTLDSNEKSQFKARELKSVYIKARGNFLKLLLHRCYTNPLNLFSQVGLIAINALGQPAQQQPGALPAGGANGSKRSRAGMGVHDLAVDMGMDPDTAAMLREVAMRKDAAVASEDFELAKRLKALQEQIKNVGGSLAALAADKARCVEEEDYDGAARLKEEIYRIRSVIVQQMAELTPRGAGADRHGGHMLGPGGVGLGMSSGIASGAGGPGGGGAYMPPFVPQQQQMYGGGGIGGGGGGGGGSAPPSNRESRDTQFLGGAGGPSGAPEREPPAQLYAPQQTAPMSARAPSSNPAGALSAASAASTTVLAPSGMPLLGSADRPIRPAPVSDLYERAGASPDRGPRTDGVSPREKLVFDQYGRPVSRQLRPARADNIEIALEAENQASARRAQAPDVRGVGGGYASPQQQLQPFAQPGPDSGPVDAAADPSQLAGVEGAASLPAPDPLAPSVEKEAAPLVEVFGEYVVRCLYSRAWSLREAAMLKMALELQSPHQHLARGPALAACATVVQNALTRDRIVNVLVACSAKLLPAVAAAYAAASGGGAQQLAATLDPTVAVLMEKLGDNTPKVREAAVKALDALAAPDMLGAPHLAHSFLLRKAPKKQAGNLLNLISRLEALTSLVAAHALLAPASGVLSEDIVQFCQDNKTFEHASGDVRKAALELCTACCRVVGAAALDGMLAPLLRPKQLDEYRAAFAAATGERAPLPAAAAAGTASAPGVRARGGGGAGGGGGSGGGGGGGGGGGAGGGGAGGGKVSSPGGQRQQQQQQPQPQPKGGAQHMPAVPETGADEGEGEGVCQFCGGFGPASENELDLHYWGDCPLLMSCSRCQQVVEIATLQEHLLEECEKRGEFSPCPTCGDAQEAAKLEAHMAARSCRAPPGAASGLQRCPLCHHDVGAGKEGWLQHLLDDPAGCAANPRNNGWRLSRRTLPPAKSPAAKGKGARR